jgi:hypothetical protein
MRIRKKMGGIFYDQREKAGIYGFPLPMPLPVYFLFGTGFCQRRG